MGPKVYIIIGDRRYRIHHGGWCAILCCLGFLGMLHDIKDFPWRLTDSE